MEFRILGALEIYERDRALRLGGPKQRALLAVLLLHANEVVSTDRLIDALWGERPPETAAKALHVYVSQLRKALEPNGATGSGQMLQTRTPGYVLRVRPEQLDLRRFESLVAEAKLALAQGDAARGSAKLRDALALWRGPALSDLTYEPFAQAEIARLEELRLAALEERIQADLALGLHGDLVGELEALVAGHPLRERFRMQLMLALYRSGRQAEALETYREARRLLVDELGLEPSPALQRLERAVLSQDPSLELVSRSEPAAVVPTPSSRERRPRSLLVLVLAASGLAVASAATIAALVLGRNGRIEAIGTVRPNTVVEIDPATNRIVHTVDVGSRPTLAVAGEGAIWVASFDDSSLSRIDPESRTEVMRIPAGGTPTGLAVGGGAVWVTHGFEGTLSLVDPGPAQPKTATTMRLGAGVRDVNLGEGAAWVANRLEGTLLRIDLATNALAATIPVGGSPESVGVGEGAVWIANGRSLLRVDPTTNRLRARVALPAEGNRLTVSDGAVWITSSLADSVVRVSISRGSLAEVIPVGDGPTGIAAGAGAIWVANSIDGTVSRIDPASNVVVKTIAVGFSPEGVAVAGDSVWVAVQAP